MRQPLPVRPRLLTSAVLRRHPLPEPGGEGTKEHHGRLLVIAGATEIPGAAILASKAALRAGAGKVRVATAQDVATAVGVHVPELFVQGFPHGQISKRTMTSVLESAEGSNAVLIGPGMRDVPLIEALLPELLSLAALNALIIDATALRVAAPLLTEARKRGAPVILTPHQGEMQEMA